jgi:hypothetical protein
VYFSSISERISTLAKAISHLLVSSIPTDVNLLLIYESLYGYVQWDDICHIWICVVQDGKDGVDCSNS